MLYENIVRKTVILRKTMKSCKKRASTGNRTVNRRNNSPYLSSDNSRASPIDTNSLAGQWMTFSHMANHYRKLQNVKPRVDTGLPQKNSFFSNYIASSKRRMSCPNSKKRQSGGDSAYNSSIVSSNNSLQLYHKKDYLFNSFPDNLNNIGVSSKPSSFLTMMSKKPSLAASSRHSRTSQQHKQFPEYQVVFGPSSIRSSTDAFMSDETESTIGTEENKPPSEIQAPIGVNEKIRHFLNHIHQLDDLRRPRTTSEVIKTNKSPSSTSSVKKKKARKAATTSIIPSSIVSEDPKIGGAGEGTGKRCSSVDHHALIKTTIPPPTPSVTTAPESVISSSYAENKPLRHHHNRHNNNTGDDEKEIEITVKNKATSVSNLRRVDSQEKYIELLLELTQDVVSKGIYTNKGLKALFKSYLDTNKHLNQEKLADLLERLRMDLGIPKDAALDKIEFGYGSVSPNQQNQTGQGSSSSFFSSGNVDNRPRSPLTRKSLAMDSNRFTVKDLIMPEPLETIVEKNPFRIVYYSWTNFAEFNVMLKGVYQDEYFQLTESIEEALEDSEAKLTRMPEVNEIVLGQDFESKDKYHRAVVLRKISEGKGAGQVVIYFFDVGGTRQCSLSQLKPVNEEIMNFPVMSYQIVLEGMEGMEDSTSGKQKILIRDFQRLMKDELEPASHKIARVEKMDLEHILNGSSSKFRLSKYFPKYKVSMSSSNEAQGTSYSSVSKIISNLGTWKWEQLVNTHAGEKLNDDRLCKKLSLEELTEDYRMFNIDEHYYPEMGAKFTAEVVRLRESNKEGDNDTKHETAEVSTLLLDCPIYKNYQAVLQSQMDSYCGKVERTIFYPSKSEYALLKFDDDEECREFGIKPLETWCRALRIDPETDWFHLVDWDENVLLEKVDSSSYEIRRLPEEFRIVPSLAVTLCPLENGLPISKERAEALFQPGKRYTFKVTGAKKDKTRLVECITEEYGAEGL